LAIRNRDKSVEHNSRVSILEQEEENSIRAITEGQILACDGLDIYYRGIEDSEWKKWNEDNLGSLSERLYSSSNLISRLTRTDISQVIQLDDGSVLVFVNYRSVVVGEPGDIIHQSEGRRGRGPLNQGVDVGEDGRIFYGEYWRNSDRNSVRIYGSSDKGAIWEVLKEFPSGSIRHVHVLQYDPYTGNTWLATGDEGDECRIGYSEDFCNTFTYIGRGSQKWRTAGLIFTSDWVYWGTDNPMGENHIYRWNRESGETDKVADPIGPVYYTHKAGDWLLFSTAVEKGEGEQDGYARVYGLDKGLELHELLRAKKDRWHPVLFGYGLFEFPRYEVESEGVWVVARGLETPWKSMKFRIEEN